MGKLQRLRKRLIRQTIISLIVLSVIGGAGYAISSYYEMVDQRSTTVERELRQALNNIAQLEQKFNLYESSFSAYEDIRKDLEAKKFYLDLDMARAALNAMRKHHRITNLNLVITPQENFSSQHANFIGYQPVFREVTLTFSALSDAHILAFTDSIRKYFSGFIRFTNVEVKRARPLSETILHEVQRGSAPAMVDAKITFLWIGIETQPIKETGNEAGDAL